VVEHLPRLCREALVSTPAPPKEKKENDVKDFCYGKEKNKTMQ
jgi:hypothetical protein